MSFICLHQSSRNLLFTREDMPAPAIGSRLFHFSNQVDDEDNVETYDERENRRLSQPNASYSKLPGACVDCKSVKVRCEYVQGERKCKRCQAKHLPCQPRERKKRKAADTHEELQKRALQQDRQIEELLLQYDKLKKEQKIKEWMSRPLPTPANGNPGQCIKRKGRYSDATAAYYSAGHAHRLNPPEIVKHCSLYPDDITELFAIFFARINPYFSILDEDLHTPKHLIWSSPFLFTVICAAASRYYTARPDVYLLAMDIARDTAGKALVEGYIGVDVCQAYLILALYPVPKKRWEEDRSWLLMGVAIRMAMELGLNQPPPDPCDGREALNRTRTWLNCYCVDGSHAIQFGKMPMLPLDDYLARTSRNWYKSSPMNTPFDVHLCAYVQIILIMAQWRQANSACLKHPGSKDFDIVKTALQSQERLSQEMAHWDAAYAKEFYFMPLPICNYRGNTTRMITAYLKLVVLSVGFQHSAKRGLSRGCEVVMKSIAAARNVIDIIIEHLAPTGYLRYAMDANFLYVSFAAAFLINLLRPELLPLLDENQQQQIIVLVNRLIGILRSDDVALDGRHTPALYSRFLSSLLERHHATPNKYASQYLSTDPGFLTSSHDYREFTQPNVHCWPDVGQAPGNWALPEMSIDHMDFSLTHFISAVSQDPGKTCDVQIVDSMEMWRTWDIEF